MTRRPRSNPVNPTSTRASRSATRAVPPARPQLDADGAPPTSYEPYSSKSGTAEIEIERMKGASVWCGVFEERNAEGRVVFESRVRGTCTIKPGGLVLGAIRLEQEFGGSEERRAPHPLSLEFGRGVDLLDLAYFAASLKALVDELFAQGANENAWNTCGEGVGELILRVPVDPRAPMAPLAPTAAAS